MTKLEESALWWEKDLLMAKESAAKTISTVNDGSGMTTEDVIEEAKKLIEWFYGTDEPVNPFTDNESAETINAELDNNYQEKVNR